LVTPSGFPVYALFWTFAEKGTFTVRELKSKVVCVADALAAAAVLMMGEAAEGTPVVVIREAPYQKGEGKIKEVVRPEEEDLFL
jgi:coenzyme F420-0:L-glutamate ligase/coenzyme F420-1:gamma-L-glutamate ligase